MSNRSNHIHDLPKIAKAIQEYKTTHQTQKECAAKYGIPYKVFSYYFLNGFKKNQKVGGGLIPEETPYQKKAKGRANNYDIILVGGENPAPQQVQFQPPPVSHQYIAPPPTQRSAKPPPEIKKMPSTTTTGRSIAPVSSHTLSSVREKFNAALTVGKNGKKHFDIDVIYDN